MMIKIPHKNNGFTLLFASLVISLVLAIGLSIAEISLKQFLLASSGKESQVAFYNADTGVECALYYDYGNVTGFSFPTKQEEEDPSATMTCNGKTAAPTYSNEAGVELSSYKFNLGSSGGLGVCDSTDSSFQIRVEKTPITDDTFKTDIFSYGYNTCDTSNPRRVERGLEVKY